MIFSIQKALFNEYVLLRPLEDEDFDLLFEQAANPEVWNQHPNKNRYQREVFQIFFEGAMQSKGAFVVINLLTNKIIGSTRFYDYDEQNEEIYIGYTFYGKEFWGRNYNAQVKKLMLDYIFQFVRTVNFHVGRENFRSQSAMKKLRATNLGEIEVAYFGELPKINILYQIKNENWKKISESLDNQ